ncbi:hypothetical protein EDEG_01485, partial [Edhazardia aedis USNM 41457]
EEVKSNKLIIGDSKKLKESVDEEVVQAVNDAECFTAEENHLGNVEQMETSCEDKCGVKSFINEIKIKEAEIVANLAAKTAKINKAILASTQNLEVFAEPSVIKPEKKNLQTTIPLNDRTSKKQDLYQDQRVEKPEIGEVHPQKGNLNDDKNETTKKSNSVDSKIAQKSEKQAAKVKVKTQQTSINDVKSTHAKTDVRESHINKPKSMDLAQEKESKSTSPVIENQETSSFDRTHPKTSDSKLKPKFFRREPQDRKTVLGNQIPMTTETNKSISEINDMCGEKEKSNVDKKDVHTDRFAMLGAKPKQKSRLSNSNETSSKNKPKIDDTRSIQCNTTSTETSLHGDCSNKANQQALEKNSFAQQKNECPSNIHNPSSRAIRKSSFRENDDQSVTSQKNPTTGNRRRQRVRKHAYSIKDGTHNIEVEEIPENNEIASSEGTKKAPPSKFSPGDTKAPSYSNVVVQGANAFQNNKRNLQKDILETKEQSSQGKFENLEIHSGFEKKIESQKTPPISDQTLKTKQNAAKKGEEETVDSFSGVDLLSKILENWDLEEEQAEQKEKENTCEYETRKNNVFEKSETPTETTNNIVKNNTDQVNIIQDNIDQDNINQVNIVQDNINQVNNDQDNIVTNNTDQKNQRDNISESKTVESEIIQRIADDMSINGSQDNNHQMNHETRFPNDSTSQNNHNQDQLSVETTQLIPDQNLNEQISQEVNISQSNSNIVKSKKANEGPLQYCIDQNTFNQVTQQVNTSQHNLNEAESNKVNAISVVPLRHITNETHTLNPIQASHTLALNSHHITTQNNCETAHEYRTHHNTLNRDNPTFLHQQHMVFASPILNQGCSEMHLIKIYNNIATGRPFFSDLQSGSTVYKYGEYVITFKYGLDVSFKFGPNFIVFTHTHTYDGIRKKHITFLYHNKINTENFKCSCFFKVLPPNVSNTSNSNISIDNLPTNNTYDTNNEFLFRNYIDCHLEVPVIDITNGNIIWAFIALPPVYKKYSFTLFYKYGFGASGFYDKDGITEHNKIVVPCLCTDTNGTNTWIYLSIYHQQNGSVLFRIIHLDKRFCIVPFCADQFPYQTFQKEGLQSLAVRSGPINQTNNSIRLFCEYIGQNTFFNGAHVNPAVLILDVPLDAASQNLFPIVQTNINGQNTFTQYYQNSLSPVQ